MIKKVYLKKEFISKTAKEQYVCLVQLMRMSNLLEFWIGLYETAPKKQGHLFERRHTIEIDLMLTCCYKETIKVFCNEMYNVLIKTNLSLQLKQEISEYKAWLDNYRNDQFLQVVEKIRNDLRYHLRKDIYKDYIREGEHDKDLYIAYSEGSTYKDCVYVEPYEVELAYIADSVPDDVGSTKDEKLSWIFSTSRIKSVEFLKLIRKILREILKGNAYTKDMPKQKSELYSHRNNKTMGKELTSKQISRISLIIYLILFMLSLFLSCMPGGYIPWYCVMGLFALPPIILGPKLYRILGVIALALAVSLCFVDYQAGKRWHQKRNKSIRQQNERISIKTNMQKMT